MNRGHLSGATIAGCNKRSALHHNVRRNTRWLLRPTAAALFCLGLIAAPPTQAEQLGRLFFTPEQRAQLEYDKVQSGDHSDSRRALIINGIVQKHGGERTVWINGTPQQAGKSDERAPESVPVFVPGQSQPVKAKVGQKILVNPAAPGQ